MALPDTLATDTPDDPRPGAIRVALAGNPNSGKTSLFNALTGARQRVGNYPGVTVEKREGRALVDGHTLTVLDLPGTYSLTSFSPEERIAQTELLSGNLDVVVAVVDATSLKRSLVLVAQLMQLGANPVLCMNMSDEATKGGQRIDRHLLERLLGFPVVETVARTATGIDELRNAIVAAAARPVTRSRLVLGTRLDTALAAINQRINQTEVKPAGRWVAVKLLLDDPAFTQKLHACGSPGAQTIAEARHQRLSLEAATGMDVSLFVTERYYGFVDGLLREVVQSHSRTDARALSDAVDRVLVHRLFGLPFFALVMYAIFWLAFSVGELPMTWIEGGFAALGSWISGHWPPGSESALRSLLVDGVIGGVGGVIVFLPNILLLFLGLALLEDTGYMSRAAFLLDRVLNRFGLHGKSFVPMISGFGCSIPGIMATRTLENERDRLATMLVLPLMSCGARLPIWMLLIPAFFAPPWRAPMLWLIYAFGVGLALVLALLLRKSVLRGEEAPFVLELPPYRLPTIRAVGGKMVERGWLYVRKAGTVILAISVALWVISAYPKKTEYEVDARIAAGAIQLSQAELAHHRAAEDLRYSIAGRLGTFLEPALRPLGFDWKMAIAMIGAFAAKEVFVAQMGIVYSLGETDEASTDLRATLARDYSPLVAVSLMLFLLISAPCMATIAVTRRESGSWKWALLQLGGLTAVAYVVSLVFYQLGGLLIGGTG